VSAANITGIGVVSPIGIGKQAFLEGLLAARCGLDRLTVLDADELRVGRGGEIATSELRVDGVDTDTQRGLAIGSVALAEALADAGLAPDALPETTSISIGAGAGEMRAMERSMAPPVDALLYDQGDPIQTPNSLTSKLAKRLGIRGRQYTFINACAAGTQAVAVGADLIRDGKADIVVTGGVEILNRMVMSGFEALRAVSPTGPHPFDADRDGIQLAELAGMLILESDDRVKQRGVRPYGRIAGSGASADGFHVVQPDKRGGGQALAIQRALDNAGLNAEDIDYINAHGTGTEQNDPAELAAIQRVFGERAAQVPISSTKAMLGHALGASGAGEAVICALALREGFLPPTIGFRAPIEGYEPFDFVPNEARRGVQLRNVLSSSFAFGGNNAVLVLSAAS
jgi:3-oxoacyl-[acyl-carrier-protein] synthase II